MKKVEYKDITREEIEMSIKEYFSGAMELTYKQLEDKILSGYVYMLRNEKGENGERKTTLYTNKWGVEEFMKACKELNLPACICGKSIYVYDEAIGTQCILDVKITKNEEKD